MLRRKFISHSIKAFIGINFIPKWLSDVTGEPKRVTAFGTMTAISGWNGFGNESSGSSITSGSTNTIAVPANSLVIILVALDNRSTSDGQTNDVTSITDPNSNTYVKAGEYTNDLGGAASGACVAVYYANVTSQINEFAGTITVNFSGNVTCKRVNCYYVSKDSGQSIGVVSLQTLSNDNSDAGSMSISGQTNQEYIWIRAIASETDTTGITATSGYTAVNGGASGSGGSEKGHINLAWEYKKETSTGTTSDPSMTDTTADRASILFGFYQYTPVSIPHRVMVTGKP